MLVEATSVLRDGARRDAGRASGSATPIAIRTLPAGAVVVEAVFAGTPGEPGAIGAEMDRIAAEREASQPLRSRTGGSTFKNPDGHKAWALIDAAGCRGLRRGDAQVSEKHCNFLLNLGARDRARRSRRWAKRCATRVKAHSGVTLEWEIQRVGRRRMTRDHPHGDVDLTPLHIAVLMGGWSAEREVSLMSGAGVADALESLGHRVTRIDMDRDVAARLAEAKPDLVFNALHGTPGEDGSGAGHARPDGAALHAFAASRPR